MPDIKQIAVIFKGNKIFIKKIFFSVELKHLFIYNTNVTNLVWLLLLDQEFLGSENDTVPLSDLTSQREIKWIIRGP
ncbi:MAG: hypothetical protein GTN82_04845 [Candidatus Aminicenantes bacterium]|nr:hypothetical protein [Candidatus Aminicenantes bacterium]NIO79939.1 hypothetical protein [Candidatus Aminicenantes bacterium]NIQ65904.1 hypothetical protein [Candidatus Aminicenantes bacterium]NIR04732.1 hypothetical protein [Candidatus Aminicenantes bacterium]NIT21889.1 hypothetical protein [Candidatus Aminicenantes bacterium]